MPSNHPLHEKVTVALQNKHHLTVDPRWLDEFLATRGSNPPPLPAVVSTAQFRILASDITTSLSPSPQDALPSDVADVNVKGRRLSGTVIVQVLDVLDVGSSKWSQVEAIERVERGEEVRGREVIRTVDIMDDEDGSGRDPSASAVTRPPTATAPASRAIVSMPGRNISLGPHKLVVQDARGTKAVAFELDKIPKIGISISALASPPGPHGDASSRPSSQDDIGMFIGCKLVLKPGTIVRRGMIMLQPQTCFMLGGKVEAWDKKWKEVRKQKLNDIIQEEYDAAGNGTRTSR
ncbi:hypothetical protein PV08_07845 [Exophiala spinifera]|uniref:RecQ-mediated genome instability protein 1 n=1 Tax=Exophiala spinifera TaxID=91928 RepID=A0A0D2B852_9EURO|nr:uncharacterized protein PV08_07845 [Exophiala spinifera]KIW15058.1 hypothetical protein PV08_07845 [Exophiala spinifera]